MHDHPTLFIGALLLFIFGLFSKLSDRSPVTGPMIFLAAGVLMGPVGFDLFKLHFNAPATKLIAEVTLIIILFVDASMIPVTKLRDTLSGVPARLLMVGLPLTMILGTFVGWLFFPSMSLWLIALVALILSPTDAALGQAVIKSEKVPPRIRESISIESGLNDGIALPLILVCIAVLAEGSQAIGSGHWLSFMALQLSLGPIVGGLVGLIGGKLVDEAVRRGWMEPVFQSLASISLALLSYAFAELVHGNGFIAAFFAGLLLGARIPEVRHRIQEFAEAEGQMLALFVFLLLGMVGVPAAIPYLNITTITYAALSLTFIRMVPVALALIGSGLDRFTVLFVGWFGPRGIASILYLLIAMAKLGGDKYGQAVAVVVTTIVLSIVLHGMSAVPFSERFPLQPHNREPEA